MRKILLLVFCMLLNIGIQAQDKKILLDSIKFKQEKVNHAEPLFIDLMRDLGARKGEREINVGFGMSSKSGYTEYNGFVEYEWAMVDRLGMEVEIPYSLIQSQDHGLPIPHHKIEGLKLASQYTFYVNPKAETSLAVAYVHEFETNSFHAIKNNERIFIGMKMNPVFIGAKKRGHWNALIYTGPVFDQSYTTKHIEVGSTINTSLLYELGGNQRNFLGIENNIDIDGYGFHDVLRPQMKMALNHKLKIGVVGGIPISKHESSTLDIMTRVIWEL